MSGGGVVSGEEILLANMALREWSTGLRNWSKSARLAASAQRQRAHGLKLGPSTSRRGETSPADRSEAVASGALPSLGSVSTSELLTLLVRRHSFTPLGARQAITVGMLMAGYPSDCVDIAAADAFDVVEHSLGHPR